MEINSSFYRSHRKSTYDAWKRATPARFRFSVKLPRTITHDCALKGAGDEISEFYLAIEALQPRLGVVLVQLPRSLEFEARTVRAFFRSIPHLPGVRVVCEPRHVSWFTQPADELLARLNVARVAADPSSIAPARGPGGSPDFAYFRWHGSPHKYYSSYSQAALTELADTLIELSTEVWCIFDNTARHAAWDDALRFAAVYAATPIRRAKAAAASIP